MKILVATDGTKYGDAAIEMVGKLSLGAADEIRIISVVDLAMPMAIDIYGGYMPDTTELEKGARENCLKVTGEASAKVRATFPEANVTSDVLFGSPDARIVETAEEMNADLIVMGSHGYKQWERLLVGSVSDSVVHHAHCSVLVVRSAAAE